MRRRALISLRTAPNSPRSYAAQSPETSTSELCGAGAPNKSRGGCQSGWSVLRRAISASTRA